MPDFGIANPEVKFRFCLRCNAEMCNLGIGLGITSLPLPLKKSAFSSVLRMLGRTISVRTGPGMCLYLFCTGSGPFHLGC